MRGRQFRTLSPGHAAAAGEVSDDLSWGREDAVGGGRPRVLLTLPVCLTLLTTNKHQARMSSALRLRNCSRGGIQKPGKSWPVCIWWWFVQRIPRECQALVGFLSLLLQAASRSSIHCLPGSSVFHGGAILETKMWTLALNPPNPNELYLWSMFLLFGLSQKHEYILKYVFHVWAYVGQTVLTCKRTAFLNQIGDDVLSKICFFSDMLMMLRVLVPSGSLVIEQLIYLVSSQPV